MFRRRKKSSRARDAQPVLQPTDRDDRSGKDIQAGIAQLRNVPREKLADAVFMLSMAAKRQSGLIRQSINERAKADFDFDPPSSGDLAGYLAEDTVSTLRHHLADAPTLLDLLSDRSPAVHFTVNQRGAVSMLAALIREQRLDGILEGLRLAGLLNESSKDRHAGFGS
ncbi:hypothetical protein [Bradyrhizobium sp. UFLA05-112]